MKERIIRKAKGFIFRQAKIEEVGDISKLPNITWGGVTDNGYIKNSHQPEGEYVYGVNLSVSHKMNGFNLGDAMILFGLLIIVLDNKKGVFIGSRAPGFRAYKNKYPETTIDDYIRLRRNGRPRDYELAIYEREVFEIVKALPEYFPDKDSLNNGVLVIWKNEFYDSSWIMAVFLENIMIDPILAEIFLRFDFFFGSLGIFSAFVFLFNFPRPQKGFNNFIPIFLIPTLFISLFSFSDELINNVGLEQGGVVFSFGPLFIFYAILLIAQIFSGVIRQIVLYFKVDGVSRMQIKYVFFGFLLSQP